MPAGSAISGLQAASPLVERGLAQVVAVPSARQSKATNEAGVSPASIATREAAG